nr:low-density lipoprotein receptor-related protein 3 [Loxodonta africana]
MSAGASGVGVSVAALWALPCEVKGNQPQAQAVLSRPSQGLLAGPRWVPGVREPPPLTLFVSPTVNFFLTGRLSSAVPALAACSGKLEQHTERRGVIYSPAWPLNYPPGTNCSWYIQGDRGDMITIRCAVYEGLGERGDRLLQTLSYRSNHRPVSLEAAQGRLTVAYHARARSAGHGFNATYQVKGYCLPWEQPCGSSSEGDVGDAGDQGCFSEPQRCDGWWHCASGRDEQGCPACPPDQYPCEGGSGLCYTLADRCNNQKSCPDGADEKNCFSCQPGTFHCGTNLCIFETWRCDGQEDCQDGSDEHGCLAAVPRKVITAALIGSLVCGLLLVIALGCAFKLYSLRTQEYRAFETQMTRLEAEFVRREAPPSYGQLIAQGLIPPVEDFPVYSASQASVLQILRTAMRRQMRREGM